MREVNQSSYSIFKTILLLTRGNRIAGVPIVRNISEIRGDNYGRDGLSHITVAGSLMHGFKEVITVQFISFYCFCLSSYDLSTLIEWGFFLFLVMLISIFWRVDECGILGRLRYGFRHSLRVLIHRFIGIHVRKSLWFWRGVAPSILPQIHIKITQAFLRSFRFSRIVHFLSL